MNRYAKKLLIGLVSIALIYTANWLYEKSNPSSASAPGYYFVSEVADGDTIVVEMNGQRESIRLIGVDTPETHHPQKPVECFGQLASDFTYQNLHHKSVRLEADETNQNRDRYQRLLRYVYLEDGTFWNAELIKQGYGQALTAFPFTKLDEFKDYERSAKIQSKGLWSAC